MDDLMDVEQLAPPRYLTTTFRATSRAAPVARAIKRAGLLHHYSPHAYTVACRATYLTTRTHPAIPLYLHYLPAPHSI